MSFPFYNPSPLPLPLYNQGTRVHPEQTLLAGLHVFGSTPS